MENKKRKKWNGYLAAGLFMTGLAVFLGILGYFWTKAFHMPPDLPAFSSTILLTKLFFSYTMIVP